MRHLILTFGITVTTLLAGAAFQPAAAQHLDCEQCDIGPTGFHEFDGKGGLWTCDWEDCHSGLKSGHCGDYHWDYLSCEPSEDSDRDSEQLQALAVALKADNVKDQLLIFQQLRLLRSSHVTYSSDAGMWQLLNCDGSVVAQVSGTWVE